ncbi:hypothetical protein Smp_118280 [Schistosoma mansoni]|uniref:hypothetical protein n=1 Tax=Schistosoma mansoni TaxID=6183 RepID=UPI00022DC8DD|nr:hypothetical protein Smp_118280 [Schistosoma mansoni]|eukprot:XP_018647731.1 hypothetical protein Smp_118280 [Schistosoma mansoni]
MKLLLAITSNIVPKQVFEENANGISSNNDNGSSNPFVNTNCDNSLNILFNKRRCAVLRFLTEICVPRLDELSSRRDAYLLLTERTTTPSASISSSSAASAATSARNSSSTHFSTTTAGDIFVTEFRQLTTLESSEHISTGRKQKHHTNSSTTTTSNNSNISTSGQNGFIISKSPYIPYLLIKGNFLG